MIHLLTHQYDEEERDAVVEKNVFGFLFRADYTTHYSKRAIRKCREFLNQYPKILRRAERELGVPKEVITSLLWVETKHGTDRGKKPISHVYFSLIQADHPEVVKAMQELLKEKVAEPDTETVMKVSTRCKDKAVWALEELKSLQEIQQKKMLKVRALKGSYAGAFGNAQFLPSSYLKWAKSSRKTRTPDLTRMSDSIMSVANYLQVNGWKKDDPASHQAALYHYNRTQGYVDVILKIAHEIEAAQDPTPIALASPLPK